MGLAVLVRARLLREAMLRGTFYHGIGEKFDESKLEARPAGTRPTASFRLT
jgi:hypothetical protein